MSGKLAQVKQLVKAGAKIDEQKEDGFTLLMLAASRGDSKLTEYLIKQGADVNLRNEIGQTALMIAALGGHEPIVEQLALSGADVCAVDDNKRNAITWAASRGDFPNVVSRLIVLGTDYNARDRQGLTPLMRAAALGFDNSVGILLAAGADAAISHRGKTAYDMASEKGHSKVCQTIKTILENRPKSHAL